MLKLEFLDEKNELYLEMVKAKEGEIPPSFLTASNRMTGSKNFNMSEDFLWPRITKSIRFLVANRRSSGGTYYIDRPMTFAQYKANREFYLEQVTVLDIL